MTNPFTHAAKWLLSERDRRNGRTLTHREDAGRWAVDGCWTLNNQTNLWENLDTGETAKPIDGCGGPDVARLGPANRVKCAVCGRGFAARRRSAKFCGDTCKKRAVRANVPAKKPRPTWDMGGPETGTSTPAKTGVVEGVSGDSSSVSGGLS